MQYFIVFYHLLLMLQSQLTLVYLLNILSSRFWGWLTSSITYIMGNQVSLQILMWWIDVNQRIIDQLFEKKINLLFSKNWLWKGEVPATLLPLWETLRPMSNKVDVMKFFQSIMIWYMNLLTLSYPLQYAKRLAT